MLWCWKVDSCKRSLAVDVFGAVPVKELKHKVLFVFLIVFDRTLNFFEMFFGNFNGNAVDRRRPELTNVWRHEIPLFGAHRKAEIVEQMILAGPVKARAIDFSIWGF